MVRLESTEPEESPSGTLLGGRYLLGRVLGQGERAVVHEVRDLHGERDLAVKILRPEQAGSQTATAKIEREIAIQAHLNWPALTLYDRGTTPDGRPFYVVHLAPGVTVAEILLIRGGKRLAIEPALWITADIARALNSAHTRGVVHGNVCPEKVLVGKLASVDAEQARLIDFGRSRIADFDRFDSDPEDLPPGLPWDRDPPKGIAALRIVPEDLLGIKRSYESDVFGLGALLFEMIAGSLPAMEEILGGWKPGDALGLNVPAQAKELLREMLEPRPERRCRSSDDLFADIMRLIAQLRPPSPPFPDDPGPVAINFHHIAMRPPEIDWRLNRGRA